MGTVNHQFGFAEETVYGTAVSPAKYLEFLNESLHLENEVQTSAGIRPGTRYGRGARRRVTKQSAMGGVAFEVPVNGMGLLFEHLLGTVATTQPDAGGAPTVYHHEFTPGDLTGMSLTLQKGVEADDGTIVPFNYTGTKVKSADFSVSPGGLLLVDFEFDCRDEVPTTPTLGTASYPTGNLFHFAQGAIKVDAATMATVVGVNSCKIENNLTDDRFFLGSSGLKSEPRNVPPDTIGGSLDVEWTGDKTDWYDLFEADTSVELILEFIGDVIEDVQTEIFRITVADARLLGDSPQIGGADLVVHGVPFGGYDPTSGDAVTIEYQNTDTTP
jgi:hypothetical protein